MKLSDYDFNPRPRKEGDPEAAVACRVSQISIHALAKRATNESIQDEFAKQISIHALAKRATVFTKAQYNIDNISIHALAKRATHCR